MNNVQEVQMVVDVRTSREFATGHAPGAINIPLNELHVEIERLKGISGTIVVCCASGMRSNAALKILMENGLHNVIDAGSWINLQDGFTNK